MNRLQDMRFTISTQLLHALRSLHDRGWRADDVTAGHDAFLLDPGLGPAVYLTADGRILIDERAWSDGPLREATEDEAIVALVVGAHKTGIEGLIDLIPPPPEGSQACSRCDSHRWLAAETDAFALVCPDCRGTGWLLRSR